VDRPRGRFRPATSRVRSPLPFGIKNALE